MNGSEGRVRVLPGLGNGTDGRMAAMRLAMVLVLSALFALVIGVGNAFAFEATIAGGDADPADFGIAAPDEEADGASAMALDVDGSSGWYTSPAAPGEYHISSALEFAYFSKIVNGTHPTIPQDSFEGDTVVLSNNLFLGAGIDFSPVGTAEHPFEGTFNGSDGQIWTMRGFSMSVSDASGIGIFAYVGSKGKIENLEVNNASIEVKADGEQSSEPVVLQNIGVLVGYCEGTLDNCKVSASNVSIESAQNATAEHRAVIRNIGGVAGNVFGDVTGCSFDGTIKINSTGIPAETDTGAVNNIAENIGGIVGLHGGNHYIGSGDDAVYNIGHGNIANCTNAGNIYMSTSGTYWDDRWLETVPAEVGCAGGIVGYTIGNISGCSNSGRIGFPVGCETEAALTTGYGDDIGGIVGGVRGNLQSQDVPGEETTHGLFDNGKGQADSKADQLLVSNCTNTGRINGRSGSAGIVGTGDVYVDVTRCSNSGDVTVWRWNKPSPAGIISTNYANVSYCYNTGEVASKAYSGGKATFGSGYYASGIASFNTQYSGTGSVKGPKPVVSSCYNAGMIRASGDYRQGAIIGANDGTVQFCSYLENCIPDASGRDYTTGGYAENSGTQIMCYGYKSADLKSGAVPDGEKPSAIALLNSSAAVEGWETYFVPDPSGDGYPVIAGTVTVDNPIDLSNASLALAADAPYSASSAPTPTLSATLDGKTLVQNVDFRVVVDTGATSVGTVYEARIEGIGNYKGTSNSTVSYKIGKADLGDQIRKCSIEVKSQHYNWEVQKPPAEDVIVRDAFGSVIPSSEYEVSYPETKSGAYQNAGAYDITVTAKASSSSYSGTLTGTDVYRIEKGYLYSRIGADKDWIATLHNVKLGDDVRTWTDGKLENADFTFTGSEIKPVCGEFTYLNRPLELGRDYINIYGNINAEGEDESDGTMDFVNVNDKGEPRTLSIHFKSGGNFTNWVNVAYNIVPADISTCDIVATDQPYTGTARNKAVSVSINGVKLEEGVDYKVEYTDNVEPGTAGYNVIPMAKGEDGTGSGNLTGDPVTGTFKIEDGAGTIARIGGSIRYETSVLQALEAYPDGSDTVILANAWTFPDALSATSLAGALDCPILLVDPAELNSTISSGIERLGASKAVIVGGTSAVGSELESGVAGMGLSVERLYGDSRYATSEAIYKYGLTAGEGKTSIWGSKVIIASGEKFPDALAASPLAFSEKYPIFLAGTNNGIPGTLTADSRNLINESGAAGAIIVGGTSAVSSTVEKQLGGKFGSDGLVRLGGDRRDQTAVLLAQYCVDNGLLSWNGVAVADALNFPDALSGSVLQGKNGSVLLLAMDDGDNAALENCLSTATAQIASVRIFGGTGAVGEAVQEACASSLGWGSYKYNVISGF